MGWRQPGCSPSGYSMSPSRVRGGWGYAPVGFQRSIPSMLSVRWRCEERGSMAGEQWTSSGARESWSPHLGMTRLPAHSSPDEFIFFGSDSTTLNWTLDTDLSGTKMTLKEASISLFLYSPRQTPLRGARIGWVCRILFLSPPLASKFDHFNNKGSCEPRLLGA